MMLAIASLSGLSSCSRRSRAPCAVMVQPFAQHLEVANEPVDFLRATQRYALHQRAEIVGQRLAIIRKLRPQLDDVAVHQIVDSPSASAPNSRPVALRAKVLMLDVPLSARFSQRP